LVTFFFTQEIGNMRKTGGVEALGYLGPGEFVDLFHDGKGEVLPKERNPIVAMVSAISGKINRGGAETQRGVE
jgi:hypothetical protein